jgi:hypothetical protein
MKQEGIGWAGIFVGPVVWFLSLEANFALAPLMCGRGGFVPAYLVSLFALALTCTAAILCWMRWRQFRTQTVADGPTPIGTAPLSFAGAVVSGFSFLVILAQAIPTLMMGGCE